jgi:hypothetical protein
MTVVGDDRTTVVVDALRVTIMKQDEPIDGQYVVCPAPGGAEIMIRHIAVDLDSAVEPTTTHVTDGNLTGRFVFQLARGEVEIFNIEAKASRSYCEWGGRTLLAR